jgi:ElaB/YqjD/DUF883 family membrane-anchored ribosome-binding protein
MKKEKPMTLASEISRGTRRAMDAGTADFARFRGRLDKGIRRARKQASRRIDTTDHYVHDHPWMAIAVAAGAAAVIGLVAGRLMHRNPW